MVYVICTDRGEHFQRLLPDEQKAAFLDLLAYGMYVIDRSTKRLVDPTFIRMDIHDPEYDPELRQTLNLWRHKKSQVTVDLPIWRQTDPGHVG